MIKTRNLKNKTLLKMTALVLFPFSLFGGIALTQADKTFAAQSTPSYSEGYSKQTNFSNPSFVDGNKPFAQNTLSGWTAIGSSSKGKGMIIDVGNKIESDDGTVENTTFSLYKDTYMLETNPETMDKKDTRILMINSKTDKSQSNVWARKGYKSSTISLEANSYYIFSVSARAMNNGDSFVEGSIYIDGLKDKEGNGIELGYEKISPSSWTNYYFFIATGDKSQDINMQLYLGTKNTDSQGVVFFDNTSGTRYSENEFFDLAYSHGYKGNDSTALTGNSKVFMIDKLASKGKSIDQVKDMNFDFESTTASVEDNWTFISHPYGRADIVNYADFSSVTGYSKIGNDLQYQNKQGLALWTTDTEYSSHVGIRSKDIKIAPHQSYKISLKMKIAGMESGSFYLKVTENDYIYSVYQNELSNDADAENYYDVSSAVGTTSKYTSNSTNEWENDYQTIEYYVKGHALYSSSINLELWLGDSSNSTQGCVVVDDIKVEEVADAQIDSANCLTLKTSNQDSDSKNATFDQATIEEVGKYPLNATGWTTSKANDDDCESGVIYLGDNSVYDAMYDGKYDWAGINPYNSDGSEKVSNVYMMFNKTNSYQSLTSPAFTLSGNSEGYYKLSFNYYNQKYTNELNPSKIKLEVVDSKGITLFSQDVAPSYDAWSTMNVYFKTASSASTNITAKIHLGENETDKQVGGIVYLDNFAVSSSTENDFIKESNKTDTTGFYTHLDLVKDTDKVVSSSAYDFEAESYDQGYDNSNCAFGGIVRGINNAYEIENQKDNFLALTTEVASKATLTSKFTKEFTANSYYKLTFSLATIFSPSAANAANENHDCKYGVTIQFDGYEEVSGLITDGSLKDFTIYFKTGATASNPTLKFTLVSDCGATTGSALLTNIDLSSNVSSVDYAAEMKKTSYNKTVFTSEVIEAKEDVDVDNDEDIKDEITDNEDTSESTSNSSNWILIPSIITGLAIIIAIIALIFKNVKIKKIEKVKKEAYDKRLNKDHSIIMSQAQKLRDQELENLNIAKHSLEEEKVNLENEHKEFMRSQRDKDHGKISKTTEKAFKVYNSKISLINEKINIIKEKIDYTMSADHLIEIERKIVAKQDEKKSK